jgi:hypothetical protein
MQDVNSKFMSKTAPLNGYKIKFNKSLRKHLFTFTFV